MCNNCLEDVTYLRIPRKPFARNRIKAVRKKQQRQRKRCQDKGESRPLVNRSNPMRISSQCCYCTKCFGFSDQRKRFFNRDIDGALNIRNIAVNWLRDKSAAQCFIKPQRNA